MDVRKNLHMKKVGKRVKSAYRSVRSKFNAYFGATAVVGTLLAAPMLPSVANAQGNAATVIENLKEMKISDLKKLMENWKSERGDGKTYNGVAEFKDSFGVDVSNNGKNIQLKNGKRVLVSSAIYYENWDKEEGVGTGVSNVFVRVMNGMKSEASWLVPLAELQVAYKEMTGNDLKYVHIIVDHDVDSDAGEYIQLYVVPASSADKVKGGIIEEDMPVFEVLYLAKGNTLYSGDGETNVPTLLTSLKDEPLVLAKK